MTQRANGWSGEQRLTVVVAADELDRLVVAFGEGRPMIDAVQTPGRHARIAGIKQSGRRAGENLRLRSMNK